MLGKRNEPRVYYEIAIKANSYHVNFYLRVLSRYDGFFTSGNAAPAILGNQLTCFRTAISAEDEFYKISTKSDLTPLINEWDTKRDNNSSSLRAISNAFALNPADAQKQADGQRVLDAMKHYALNNDDNYENQGSKTLQFCHAVDASPTLTAAIASIGATIFYNGLKEANEQCRALIDQRNAERGAAPQQKMVDLRKRTDDEYRDLIKITDAYVLTAATATAYDSLVLTLNADVNYYEKTVFAGSGSGSTGETSNDPDQPSTDPDQPSPDPSEEGGENGGGTTPDPSQGGDNGGTGGDDNGGGSGGDDGGLSEG
jgi:hypothetical protein